MYIRTDPWTDTSNPIPALEVKDILKKQSPSSHSLAFFDQYMNIIGKYTVSIVAIDYQ